MGTMWDVVVVGAGPSGALVADYLERNGARVALLDAGPRLAAGQKAPEVDRRPWPFVVDGAESGASFDWYRVRAVGGRAHLWGGWCHRLPEVALRRAGWPRSARRLARRHATVERRLGVREGILDERYGALAREMGLSILPKRAAIQPHGRAWTPLALPIVRRSRAHTVAVGLEHRRGRAVALRVFDLRREAFATLHARAFVLAASPIETARILLASELKHASVAGIGQGLVDHMVATYVLIEPKPAPETSGRGPFPGGALVEGFVNVDEASRRTYRGGFSIELDGPHPLEYFELDLLASPDERRGLRATQISALGECFPHAGRFVDLDPERRDAAGQRVARLHVPWSPEEETLAADLRQACTQLADALAPPGSRLIKFHDPLTPGAGHESGTCRMGDSLEPCTAEGRLRALGNVWIADASVLPTAGDRHPTLTLLAQSLRSADGVLRTLGSAA